MSKKSDYWLITRPAEVQSWVVYDEPVDEATATEWFNTGNYSDLEFAEVVYSDEQEATLIEKLKLGN